ncbi:diaminopimelate dehydrogenase [Oceanobacillus rekensis]|uniref:diaminopimelate dehydrogenase n=1 Tax=Oceanobacillus rekensis TaxID=937927 RepID=UPI000B442C30|nr:diaminopimelate dehydrogenase [Oceanobacillus rekensis]
MGNKIRVGIVGYGNLGRGAEASIAQQPDMELIAVFTRRNPDSVDVINPNVKVLHIDDAKDYTEAIDVMLLCGGSATDLPEQVPAFAEMFNTVDSFDTHAKIPEYFASVDKVAQASGKTSIISVGWDPGMFSINRVMSEALLPEGETYTFWGKGLSQGHSDAVRRVEGVKNGVQYTIPSETVIEQVRNGDNPDVSKSDRHVRTCYIVAEEGADTAKIEQEIKTMPNYFDEYETTVHFISEEELKKDHSAMPHGGFVIRSGKTGDGNDQIVEYSLNLNSNPEFTASVLTAYTRAAYRMNKEGQKGAKTVYDVAPGYISPKTAEELRRDYL